MGYAPAPMAVPKGGGPRKEYRPPKIEPSARRADYIYFGLLIIAMIILVYQREIIGYAFAVCLAVIFIRDVLKVRKEER
jgi:hypothetical protein